MSKRISDDEYFARYVDEVRSSIEHYEWYAQNDHRKHQVVREHPYHTKGDGSRRHVWEEYAAGHPRLKAMNADGTWREWSPKELGT